MGTDSSWISPKLEVRPSRAHGKGVFALEGVFQGERIAIFGGDVMRIDEIDDLPEDLRSHPMQIEERFVLGKRGAAVPENADFFNHSCDPNCGFKGQMFLVAMRDIAAGEEMMFDYAMVVSQSVESEIRFNMVCACGTPMCRKVVTEDDWKRDDTQQRYDGYFSQYLQEKVDAMRRTP